MYLPLYGQIPAGSVIRQISGLPYLRVKGFEDTIYDGLKIIKKTTNYRDNLGVFINSEKPRL